MGAVERLVTDHFGVWTGAFKRRSAAGRGSSSKFELYGINKLRELILDLAVGGLLVPQDPRDEPTSELLKKIAAAKAKLVKQGKISKEKPSAPIANNERPFSPPTGWAFRRLGELLTFEYGDNLPDANRSGTGEYPVYGSNGVVGSHNEPSVKGHCIVIGRKGSAGALNLCLEEGCCVTDVAYYCQPPAELSLKFVFNMLHTLGLDSLGKGIKPGLNRNEAYDLIIAIPPLAEQHRIVAKVDELMVLCDELEQHTDASLGAHQTLVATLLNALTGAADHAHFASAWLLIAGHFDILFTTEESIDQLKRSILQLAVMGRLVPQDPNEEPASKSYARILDLPAGYHRSNKQRIKGDSSVATASLPTLPTSWARKTVDQLYSSKHILDYEDGNHGSLYPRASDFSEDGVIFLTAAQIESRGEIAWEDCQRLRVEYANRLTKGWSTRGDVYFTHNATVGRTAIAINPPQEDFLLGTSVTFYRINGSSINSEYLYLFFSSWEWYRQAAAVMQQTTRNQVSITKQALFTVALPPVSEQHRIVAKVDELFALCDQLRARLTDAQTTQLHLADALTENALAGAR